MGIFDKAKDLADEHAEQVNEGVKKAGDEVDARTDDKYSSEVDKGEGLLRERLGTDQGKPKGTGA
jgi:hypothetical protein